MGILSDSVIVADHLATVLPREIDKVIGRCTCMPEVEAAPAGADGSPRRAMAVIGQVGKSFFQADIFLENVAVGYKKK
jgi:hypothetical protein